jgi:hypothetical protein
VGYCDKCNKFRELRFLVSYARGVRVATAVCSDCDRTLVYKHVYMGT